MKLYGAFSASFLFQTACHFLKAAGDGDNHLSCAYTRALEIIVYKEFQDIGQPRRKLPSITPYQQPNVLDIFKANMDSYS